MSYNIIIDGYNIIGGNVSNVMHYRDNLIETLIEYKKRCGHGILLVFDGWKTGTVQSSIIEGGVEVVYTGRGDKADDFIKRMIDNRHKTWVVVTSDRDISSYAWSCDCIPIKSDIFMGMVDKSLNKRIEPELKPKDDDDDDCKHVYKKGNPKMTSRKDRLIQKVLSRL